ncbi:hypothetical protein [Aliikangiella maris]|uniref:Uncharacterized protein n=2 Tax=Aliikangiella maris TaxID=3162458 RepID=A0ABV2BUR3_9GAMM
MKKIIKFLVIVSIFNVLYVSAVVKEQLEQLLIENITYKESLISYLIIDFNQDGYEDVLLLSRRGSSIFLSKGEIFTEVHGDIGQYINSSNVVIVEEKGKLALRIISNEAPMELELLYFLSEDEKQINRELIKETCKELVEQCISRTHKNYKLKPYFSSEEEFQKNFYHGSLKDVVSNKKSKLLHSKSEEVAETYLAVNTVNSAISSDIVRVFDRTTNEFVGYVNLWTNKFVSLKFLPIDTAKHSKNDIRPNFEVYQVYGEEPVVRLKEVPKEKVGAIVGAPIVAEEKRIENKDDSNKKQAITSEQQQASPKMFNLKLKINMKSLKKSAGYGIG